MALKGSKEKQQARMPAVAEGIAIEIRVL